MKLNLSPKAVLLIDNTLCHPEEEMLTSREIRPTFLFANVTLLMRPMNKEVIVKVKSYDKKKLIIPILECEGKSQ